MKIFAGNSNRNLAQEICDYLHTSLGKASVTYFSDREVFVEIGENVRGEDVFIVQSTSCPANDYLMELLIMIDAVRRSSARRITGVIPYFGYCRQDRKPSPRTPISAKLVANLITQAGADRVIMLDLHAGQVQGFFDIPTDNLYALPILERDIKERNDISNLMVVSPDVGGVVRARALAKRLGCLLAIVDKRREHPGKIEVMNIIGKVEGKDCILIDDIVDTGGTLCGAADALYEQGALCVTAYITHGVLSSSSIERIEKSKMKELVITDSIQPTDLVKSSAKIRILTIAQLMGEAINRTFEERSISSLFD
ncbi:ribose-phosphate pyrophosphokinase [Candidatus Liberibacter asiaticus]